MEELVDIGPSSIASTPTAAKVSSETPLKPQVHPLGVLPPIVHSPPPNHGHLEPRPPIEPAPSLAMPRGNRTSPLATPRTSKIATPSNWSGRNPYPSANRASSPRMSDIPLGSTRFQELLSELCREHEETIRSLNEELDLVRGTQGMPKPDTNTMRATSAARNSSPQAPGVDELDATLHADITPPTRQVKITFGSATNLKNADLGWFGHKSDPYCICHWRTDVHSRWRTPAVKNNLNPVWDHTIDIGSCRFDDELTFSVWDEDKFKKDDFLGRASLPTYVFCTAGFEGNLPLRDVHGRQHGDLYVKISIIQEPASMIPRATALKRRQASLDSLCSSSRDFCDEPSEREHDESTKTTHARLCWELLVRLALDAVSVEMRWPRAVWRTASAPGAKSFVLQKQATQRLTAVVEISKQPNLYTGGPSRVSYRSLRMSKIALLRSAPWEIIECGAMDPHSKKRIMWAFVGMVFMIYDLIVIPMQAFGQPESIVLDVVTWTGQIFWSIDIIVNFFTGVYINSQLQKDLTVVARRYVTTWFLFDLLVTIPSYLPLLAGESTLAQGLTQSVRTVRIFRLLRLVRLAKFEVLLNEILEVINSPGLLLGIRMLKHNVLLIIWNHIVACCWFLIGEETNGWVYVSSVADETYTYRYLTSLHWTLAQYQGNSEIMPVTSSERLYAVVFLQCAMIILALFVSRLTNMMRQMQELMQERNMQQRSVRSYLAENNISASLSVRVKKYVEWQRRVEKTRKEDEEVLLILPTPILMDLLEEVRGPVLQLHPFFSVFCPEFSRISRRLCHEAVTELTPAPGETIFAPGDDCDEMYFVRSGQLRYLAKPRGAVSKVQRNYRQTMDRVSRIVELPPDGIPTQRLSVKSAHAFAENSERVNQGFWLSEAVLWCEWEHCGDLIGLEDSILLSLQYESFAHITSAQTTAFLTASLYARKFVAAFDRFGRIFTDLIDHAVLFDDTDLSCSSFSDIHWSDKGSESHKPSLMSGRSTVSLALNRSLSSLPQFGPLLSNVGNAMIRKVSYLFGGWRNGNRCVSPLDPIMSQNLDRITEVSREKSNPSSCKSTPKHSRFTEEPRSNRTTRSTP